MTTYGGSGADELLDALAALARVEHALCVEYVLIFSALGLGLPIDQKDPVAVAVDRAAQTAFTIALGEMGHLAKINAALRLADRPPQIGRGSALASVAGANIALGAITTTELEHIIEREIEIAAAVDRRYADLRRAVAATELSFEGKVLDQLMVVLDAGSDHAGSLAELASRLDGVAPTDYLRAVPREPADDLERTLLRLSDQNYGLVLSTLGASFAHDDALGGQLHNRAITLMDGLNEINLLLMARGLLPTLALP
jgi:hypothetical protein